VTRNLCSLERAKLNLPNATTSDDRTIAAVVAAASDAIRKWCRRDFTLRRYDELYDGVPSDRLLLRQYPVHAVESVRHSPQVVLEVTNTGSANQQARAAVTRDGVELVRVASGTMTRDTSVTFAANATMQAVATAITALANGWSATAVGSSTGDYGLWPSADLYVAPSLGDGLYSQGPFDCRGRYAGFTLHVGEAAGFLYSPSGWLYRAEPWEGGTGYWRVTYTAGYAEPPEAVVEACAEWASALFEQTRRDPSLAVLQVPGAVSQTYTQPSPSIPPKRVAALLAPYRRYVV
jgi:hypothetical protein